MAPGRRHFPCIFDYAAIGIVFFLNGNLLDWPTIAQLLFLLNFSFFITIFFLHSDGHLHIRGVGFQSHGKLYSDSNF